MAQENEDGQEKTEEATPKRLEEARKKGQIPRSRELTTMAMLLISAIALALMGQHIIESLGTLMRSGLIIDRNQAFDHFAVIDMFSEALTQSALLLSPFLLIMVVLGTVIGGLVVALYLPIFQLGSVVSGH